MTSQHALNYLSRNSRKNKHAQIVQEPSPLMPNTKNNRKQPSSIYSAPNSPRVSFTHKPLRKSCHLSRDQILIQDVDEQVHEWIPSIQKAQGFENWTRQQNNLVCEYLRRAKIVEQQRKKEHELFQLKECINLANPSFSQIGLDNIEEEKQSNYSESPNMDDPISPITADHTLHRKKSLEIFQQYSQKMQQINPETDSKQLLKKKSQKQMIFQTQEKESQKTSLFSFIEKYYRMLQLALKQMPSQQQYSYFLQQQQTLKVMNALKQSYLRQQKEKSILKSLIHLSKMSLNPEEYLLSSKEEQLIHRNRIVIFSLVKELAK